MGQHGPNLTTTTTYITTLVSGLLVVVVEGSRAGCVPGPGSSVSWLLQLGDAAPPRPGRMCAAPAPPRAAGGSWGGPGRRCGDNCCHQRPSVCQRAPGWPDTAPPPTPSPPPPPPAPSRCPTRPPGVELTELCTRRRVAAVIPGSRSSVEYRPGTICQHLSSDVPRLAVAPRAAPALLLLPGHCAGEQRFRCVRGEHHYQPPATS